MTEPQVAAARDEVEVAHEALIRHWPRLQKWLDEDRAALLLRESVREAAQEWERHGHDESYLVHRGRRLDEVEALRHHPRLRFNTQERAYLDTAVALQKREEDEREAQRQRELAAQRERAELAEQRAVEQAAAAQQLRQRLLAAIGLAALALLAAAGAFIGFRQAEEQRGQASAAAVEASAARDDAVAAAGTAEAERARALARQLQAQAQNLSDEEFDLALLLSLEADRLANTLEAKGNVLNVLQANPRFKQYLALDDATSINGIALSPTDHTLASTSESGAVRLWDLDTGTSRVISDQRLKRAEDPGFSADGRTLTAGGCVELDELGICQRGGIFLWNVDSGQERARLSCPSIPSDITLIPDASELFAICGFTLYGWDLSQGTPDQPGVRVDGISRVAVSPHPDSQFFSFAAPGTAVTLVNSETEDRKELERPAPRPPGLSVLEIAFSPDGKTLAVAYSDATIYLWDTESGTPTGPPLSATSGVWQVAISPDGAIIAGADFDGTLLLWDVQTGRMQGAPVAGHRGGISSFALGETGTLITGGADGRLARWDIRAEHRVGHVLHEGHVVVEDAAFSLDGSKLAFITSGITLWDLQSLQRSEIEFELPRDRPGVLFAPRCLAFAPDGKTLAAGTLDGTIVRWEVATGRQKGATLVADENEGASGCTLAYSPNGQLLAFGLTGQDQVTLWDPTSRQRRIDSLSTPLLKRVMFSPDSQNLLTLSTPDAATLWDVTVTPAKAEALGGDSASVVDAAFGWSDHLLMTAGSDSTLRRGDLSASPPTFEYVAGLTARPTRIAVSPDESLLAVGGQEGAMLLLDAATGLSISTLTESQVSNPDGLVFSPDGHWLASWTLVPTHKLVLWDVDFQSWRNQACALAQRNLTADEWQRFIGSNTPYEPTCPNVTSGEGTPATPGAEEQPLATPLAPSDQNVSSSPASFADSTTAIWWQDQ